MRKFLLYLFGALVVVSLIGTRWEDAWNYVFGGSSPLWRRIVMDLQWLDKQALELGFFPIGIAIGVVGLTLVFLWPQIWESATGFERFLNRQRDVFQVAKNTFHMLSNRAYHEWQKYHTSCPATLNELIDNSSVPAREQFLSNSVPEVESALKASNADLWQFCSDLYREIEKSKGMKGFSPSYLTPEECLEFSDARKRLMDFWEFEARRIYAFPLLFARWWWFKKLAAWHLTDRSLRLLPFLEAALAKEIGTNLGAQHMFRIAERAFCEWRAGNT